MSRAFVKEDDGAEAEILPDRPVSPHPNFVTAEGLAAIDAAIGRLAAALAATPAEERGTRANLERDLRYWRQRRATAEIVPPAMDGAVVRFGTTVTMRRDDGREQTFHIVGEDEADPARGALSYVSPLARALTGKGVGDVVEVAGGEAEIIAVS